MPRFGSFETVSELSPSGGTRVYVARRVDGGGGNGGVAGGGGGAVGAGGAARFVVKERVAVDDLTGERDQGAIEDFLKQVEIQKRGGAGWAPIHESAMTEGGAFYATDLYATSDERSQNLDTLFAVRKLHVDEQTFAKIIDGVVAGLRSMEDGMRRGHGSLKPQNVFLDVTPMPRGVEEDERAKAAVPKVWLADPLATDVGGKTLRDDLPALASLIYLIAFNQTLRRTGMVSLREESDWKERGYDGSFWRGLCAELLGQTNVTPALDQTQRKVRVHEAKVSGGKGAKPERSKVAPAAVERSDQAAQGGNGGGMATGAAVAAAGVPEAASAWGDAEAGAGAGGLAGAGKKPGSSKLLMIGGVVGLLLVAGGAAAYFATRGGGDGGNGGGGAGGAGGSAGGGTSAGRDGASTTDRPLEVKKESVGASTFMVLTPEDVKLRRFAQLLNVPGETIRAQWASSGEPVLVESARVASTALSSTPEQWEMAAKPKGGTLTADERAAVANDLARLRELEKKLTEWPALKEADELSTKFAGMAGLATLAEETAARASTFRRLIRSPELDVSASKAKLELGEDAVRIGSDLRAARKVLETVEALQALKSVSHSKAGQIAGDAEKELGAGATSLASIADRASGPVWKSDTEKLRVLMSRDAAAFDRGTFDKQLAEKSERWGTLTALDRLRSFNALADDEQFKAVKDDPREAWKTAQLAALDVIEKELAALGGAGKVWPEGSVPQQTVRRDALAARANVEQEGATTTKLFGHSVASAKDRMARVQSDVDALKRVVDNVRLASSQKIEEVLNQLVNAGASASGLAGPSIKLVSDAARTLDKGRAGDEVIAAKLRKVLTETNEAAVAIGSAVTSAGESLPGKRWARDAWRASAEKLGEGELTKAVTLAISEARTGAGATVSADGARGVIESFAGAIGEAMAGDGVLLRALGDPANVEPGGAVGAALVQLAATARAKETAPLLVASGVTEKEFGAVAKFDALKSVTDAKLPAERDRLLNAMKSPGSAVEAKIAVERLMSAGAWPSSAAEFKLAGGVIQQMEAAVIALPGQAAEGASAIRARGAGMMQQAYLRLLAQATAQTMAEVVGALDEQITPRAGLPAWAKFNIERATVASRLANAPDDRARQIVTELATLAKGAGVAAEGLSALTSESGPTFAPAQAGPGKTGRWTLVSGDGASETLTYKSTDGVEMMFVAIGDASNRVFMSATEVSLAAVNAAMDAEGFKALAADLGGKFTKVTQSDEGVRGWRGEGGRLAPAKPVDAGDKSMGWLYYDKTSANIVVFPAGAEPAPPSLDMPAHHFPARSAVRVANAMGGRLPTAAEWSAALQREGGVAGLVAGARVRDDSWRAWVTLVMDLRNQQKQGRILYIGEPWRSALGDAPANRQATARSGGEKVLFRPVNEGNGQRFKNLIGNVAELVHNVPAQCRVELMTNAASMASVQVVGGSALSPLTAEQVDKPQALTPANPERSFADVGFRVVFEAQGAEALAVRAARAIESIGYAKPSP